MFGSVHSREDFPSTGDHSRLIACSGRDYGNLASLVLERSARHQPSRQSERRRWLIEASDTKEKKNFFLSLPLGGIVHS